MSILILLELASLAACLWLGRGLLDELRSRRTLVGRQGVVDKVESRSGGASWTAYRAIVRYEDGRGQSRRLTTAWAETTFSVGDAVVVGEGPAGQGAPRLLLGRVLAQHVVRTLIPGVIAVGVLVVLVRVWLSRGGS